MIPIQTHPTEMNYDLFTLREGQVMLQYPATMSAESYQDFESWIEIELRKIRRSVTLHVMELAKLADEQTKAQED